MRSALTRPALALSALLLAGCLQPQQPCAQGLPDPGPAPPLPNALIYTYTPETGWQVVSGRWLRIDRDSVAVPVLDADAPPHDPVAALRAQLATMAAQLATAEAARADAEAARASAETAAADARLERDAADAARAAAETRAAAADAAADALRARIAAALAALAGD